MLNNMAPTQFSSSPPTTTFPRTAGGMPGMAPGCWCMLKTAGTLNCYGHRLRRSCYVVMTPIAFVTSQYKQMKRLRKGCGDRLVLAHITNYRNMPQSAGRMARQKPDQELKGLSSTVRMTLRSASSREHGVDRLQRRRPSSRHRRSPSPAATSSQEDCHDDSSDESEETDSDDSMCEGMTSIIDPEDLPVPEVKAVDKAPAVTVLEAVRRNPVSSDGQAACTDNLPRTPRSSRGHSSPRYPQRESDALAEEMMRRIVAQPMAGRPLPSSNDTADTERLGYELKVRLASRSPVLRCHESVSSGRLHFYETSPSRREVPIYDIDEEGDAHLLCSVSVRATKS